MLPTARVVHTGIGDFLLLDGADSLSQTLRTQGTWEPVTLMIAKALVAIRGGRGTIVDGGANVGAFTIPMARAFAPACRVVSFEVQRLVYYQLCAAIVLNGLDRVHAHNLGLGSAAGRVAVPVPDYAGDANVGALSLDPAVRRARREAGRGCATDRADAPLDSAELVPLDSFAIDDACLIKLDVEGMELAALRGAAATLERCAFPPLLFELWDAAAIPALAGAQRTLLDHVAALGYEVTTLGETAIAQHVTQRSVLRFTVEEDEGGRRRLAARQVER